MVLRPAVPCGCLRHQGGSLTLAQRLNDDYEDLKKQRSSLDFRGPDRLHRRSSGYDGVGAWVHYKLDQGIDYILVDEA